ncbi:MAG: hypothetical protein U0271_21120 [Polyangiaceae bacterium]
MSSSAPATPDQAKPPVEHAAPEVDTTPGVLGYKELWRAKPTGWAHGSLITPSGDLAVSASGTLTIYARHDGSVLESSAVCDAEGPRAMTLLGSKLYIACNDQVVELSLPGLSARTVLSGVLKSSSNLFREAAFGGGTLVYVHNDGNIEVYATKTWSLVRTEKGKAQTFSPTVTVSGDGARFAVSSRDQPLQLFENGKSTSIGTLVGFAFSPDGQRVFGSSASFRAGELTLKAKTVRDLMETGSWLTAATYFDKDLLAVAGSDGLSVLELGTGKQQALANMTAETLAVSADGNLICSADRGDTVACFARGTIAKSTYR